MPLLKAELPWAILPEACQNFVYLGGIMVSNLKFSLITMLHDPRC